MQELESTSKIFNKKKFDTINTNAIQQFQIVQYLNNQLETSF